MRIAMKRIVGLMLSVMVAFSLSSCFFTDNQGTEQAGKSVLDRAKELSSYLDKVPANYEELKGGEPSISLANEAVNEMESVPASSVVRSVRAKITELTPAYRPNAVPFNILSDNENYSMNSVDVTLNMAKEEAEYVKGRFQIFSSLNEWIGGSQGAFRLQYDKQADRIGLEEYFLNDDNTITYRLMKLNLVKDGKIEFSVSTKIIDRTTNETIIAYDTEYVEDDYYYYAYYPFELETFSTVIFIDLKTSPTQIFNSTGVLVNGGVGQPWRKEIVLDFDDGKKIVYQETMDMLAMDKPEFKPCQVIRAYGEDGNILFGKSDTEFLVDLWQLSGWTSVQSSGGNWQNGCTLKTQKADYFVEFDGWLKESENQNIAFLAEPYFEDDGCFSAKFKLIYNIDVTENTVENLKLALAEYGLSLKYDYDDIFDEYVNDGFDASVAKYEFDRFDYETMSLQDFKGLLLSLDDGRGELFMETLPSIVVTDEIEAMNRKDVSEAYEMLDVAYIGNASVDFEKLTLSISSLNVTVPNSVLLEKGGEYSLIVQLKGNKSSLELAREKAVYASGDLFVSMPQKKDLSLTKNLEVGDKYTLVVYLCNKNGVRCSENFYPVITPTGEGRTTVKEGARTVRNTVRVEDGLLTVMKW